MSQVIYWRRDLPPLRDEVEGEHEVEADGPAIPHDLVHRAELWGRCYPPLIAEAERRITQEVTRLKGACAHVVDEVITARVDDVAGTFRLHGRFRYVLYRRPA